MSRVIFLMKCDPLSLETVVAIPQVGKICSGDTLVTGVLIWQGKASSHLENTQMRVSTYW